MMWGRVIKNPILQVVWSGWRSDTLTLQQNGWELAVDEDVYLGGLRIAIYNRKMKLMAMTNEYVKYEYQKAYCTGDWGRLPIIPLGFMMNDPQFHVNVSADHLQRFASMDATPMMGGTDVRSVDDLRIFRPLAPLKEIVVERKNVDQLLEEILRMQSPKQKEIREKARKEMDRIARSGSGNVVDMSKYREVYNPETDIVAQVVAM